MGPISDLNVLDLTQAITGPYATKLLADFGADVIKVEPPGGDLARGLGPFPGDVSDPEKSGTFFYLNTNKRSVVLQLRSASARDVLGRLVGWADVVVESFAPGTLDRLGVGWDWIHAQKPDISLVSITNFGQTGPYRDYLGSELVLFGFAGEMYTMGIAEREPVKMFGTAALVQSGAAAATAMMGALFASKFQGIGQHVDFSIADSHILGVDRRHAGQISFEFSGRATPRTSSDSRAVLSGVYPCADGFVEFTGAGTRVDRLRSMLGSPEWFADSKWDQPAVFTDPELGAEFEANFYEWLAGRAKAEIWAAAQDARVLCGPLFTVEELSRDRHFRDRGFWTNVQHQALGEVEVPGRPFIMPESPWEIRRPAPLLGEHTREILEAVGMPAREIDELAAGGAVEVR